MAYYTNISLSDANTILDLYGLGHADKITPVGHGITNSNYLLTLSPKSQTPQKLILKISNDKSLPQLIAEQKILLLLHQLNYPYSVIPFRTLLHSPVYEWNHLHGVLYPFKEGSVTQPSPSVCSSIGAALGQLHSLSIMHPHLSPGNFQLRSATDVGFFPERILATKNNPLYPQDFKDALKDLISPDDEKLYQEVAPMLPTGLLHGDLYFDNALFVGNRLNAILDFEQSGRGFFIYDIGVSITGTCLMKGDVDVALLKSFLQGYQQHRTLIPCEVAFFRNSLIFGLLAIALWRIHRFYLGKLSPEKKWSHRQLLARAYKLSELNI